MDCKLNGAWFHFAVFIFDFDDYWLTSGNLNVWSEQMVTRQWLTGQRVSDGEKKIFVVFSSLNFYGKIC